MDEERARRRKNEASVENIFSSEEAERAILEQMRRTAAWQDHERYHREHGEEARLVLRHEEQAADTSTVVSRAHQENAESQRRARPIPVGWCQCQSPTVRLVLGEDGDVANKPVEPIETNSYGVAGSAAPAYGAGSAPQSQYTGTQPSQNLYK
jgi:hypothetical protein